MHDSCVDQDCTEFDFANLGLQYVLLSQYCLRNASIALVKVMRASSAECDCVKLCIYKP